MGAVTAALAGGLITPGEAQAIARVFTTFVQTIETSDFDQRLQVLETRQAEDRPTQPRPWPLSSLQPEEEPPLQTRCSCSGLSYYDQP